MSQKEEPVAKCNDDLNLEERCRGVMESVVRMRVRYPAHLRKEDKNIANMEAKLLKREMSRKLKPLKEMAFDEKTQKLLENVPNIDITGIREMEELLDEMNNLEKIIIQLRRDEKHKIFREGIDSQAILHKIETLKASKNCQ